MKLGINSFGYVSQGLLDVLQLLRCDVLVGTDQGVLDEFLLWRV